MGAWTSGLTAADAAAVGACGFVPAGAVFGVSVCHVGFSGTAYCGGYESNRPRSEEWSGPRAAGEWGGFGASVAMLRKVRRRALERLTAQARSLAADGVIGIDLQLRPYDGDRRAIECTAWGTAVRALQAPARPALPFLATVSALDLAALLGRGWVPAGIALGVGIEIEHHDLETRKVTGIRGVTATNAEVPAVTRAVQRARIESRRTCDGELTRLGADGGIVTQMTLQTFTPDCHVYEGLHDTVAEAVVVATAVAKFADPISSLRQGPTAGTRRGGRGKAKAKKRPAMTVLPLRELTTARDARAVSPAPPRWFES